MYKSSLAIVLLLIISFIQGCANSTVTGFNYEPISPDKVRVWYGAKPPCQLEEIGFISVNYAVGVDMVTSLVKKKAAAMGAEHVIMNALKETDDFEYKGGAVAATCVK